MSRGQSDVAMAIIVGIMLLILAPIFLNIMGTISDKMGDASGDVQANQTAHYIKDQYNNFWDFITIAFFFINIIVLFLTAFFVNMNPIFFIVYIFFAIMLMLLVPGLQDLSNRVYNMSMFAGDITHLPYSNWLQAHLWLIALIVIAVTAIIMYGKIRGRGGAGVW
jgi:hypothetical protein